METEGGTVIRKTYADAACMEKEKEVYRLLAGTPLPHSEVLRTEKDCILLQPLHGETFSDLLERREKEDSSGKEAFRPWKKLSAWIVSFCRLTGLTLTDCNLRNFLYDAAEDTVYGVDFEECAPGTAADALARLCAHILLHGAGESEFKRNLVTRICGEFQEALPEQHDGQVREMPAPGRVTGEVHQASLPEWNASDAPLPERNASDASLPERNASDAPLPERIAEEMSILRRRRMLRHNRQFSAAVLAGGRSTRMGRDKAALPFNGMTLLEYQVEKLRSLGIEEIMISGSALEVDGTRRVPDILPHCGPLSGIHACLRAARHEAVLFLSVDTPLVSPDILQTLLDAHTSGVTLLHHGERTEPLLGIYDRALSGLCEPILRSGRTGVWRLLEQTDVRYVTAESEAELFLNCNTPEDYHAAMRCLKKEP